MNSPLRIAVLLSGSGTTLQNLLDRCADGQLSAEVVLVIANKAEAYGLTRAQNAGVPTVVVNRREHEGVRDFSQAIFEHCRRANADLVCMAGFLQLVEVPEDFTHRVVNVHPSLIPAFCGKGYYGSRVHNAVLKAGVKLTGCTVHFADNEYDHGPIILQRSVPVLEEDTPETLATRVQQTERDAYVEAIQLYATGRLKIEGHHVRIAPEAEVS